MAHFRQPWSYRRRRLADDREAIGAFANSDNLTLLPDPGPGGKLNTDLEGRDDKADEAAIFAVIQGSVGYPAVGAWCDA